MYKLSLLYIFKHHIHRCTQTPGTTYTYIHTWKHRCSTRPCDSGESNLQASPPPLLGSAPSYTTGWVRRDENKLCMLLICHCMLVCYFTHSVKTSVNVFWLVCSIASEWWTYVMSYVECLFLLLLLLNVNV